MSRSALSAGLRHLRSQLAAQQHNEDSDEQLLHDFAAHRDEGAFAVLVHRHGPMVLHVCRRVLEHEQDAEDTFQATFLVLARKAAALRKRSSLASFLHGTAYRLALSARRSAARRRKHEGQAPSRSPVDPLEELSWREVRALLDEEIARLSEKYRSVFILCCLEELSRAEAAQRLGLSERTVLSRLATARQRLSQRLGRRGLQLTAVLAASTLATQSATALSPVLLANTIKAALATAAGEKMAGMVSASVAELVQNAAEAMMVSKVKIAAIVLVVSVMAVATSGSLVCWHGRASGPLAATATDKPPPRRPGQEQRPGVEVSGRVIDPEGKPVRGAKVVLAFHHRITDIPSKIWATSGADGRFQFTMPRLPEDESPWESPEEHPYVLAAAKDFGLAVARLDKPEATANLTLRLVRDDKPIRGRLLDLQGRPIAGVRVRISDYWMFGKNKLYLPIQGDLTAWLAALKDNKNNSGNIEKTYWVEKAHLTGLCSSSFDLLFPPVTTGADGRFEIHGIGRERLADLFLEGPTIATQIITAMTRSSETIRIPRSRAYLEAVYYGTDCEIVAAPTKPVVGVVRDRDTGKPLAGVTIMSNKIANPRNISNYQWELLRTTTDKEGRYRLIGLPKGEGNELLATTDDLPYLPWSKKVENTPGLGTVTVDFALKRGIWVKGRVIEKGTGKPLRGGIGYYCFRDNPHVKEIPQVLGSTDRLIRKDGSFQLVAAPGHGLIRLYVGYYYLDGVNPEKIKGPRWEIAGMEVFATAPNWHAIHGNNVVDINPKPGEESIVCDLIAVRYRTLEGTVLGPEGKPLAGARRRGWTKLPGSAFTIELPPGKLREPRTIVFMHEGKKLAGFVTVHGDEKEPLQVRLRPWGVVTGRLVNPQGEPLTGVKVSCTLRVGEDFPDKTGRFRIEGLTPGLKHEVYVSKEGRVLPIFGGERKDLIVKPGETLDLGVLKVRVMQ